MTAPVLLRWMALVVLVAGLAVSSVGQYFVAEGRPAWFFPPATGMYQFPFRQARELTSAGLPRTEVGCVDVSGDFGWRPFNEQILTRMPGPHHRKIAWNQVLSDSIASPTPMRIKKTVIRLMCTDPSLTALLACSGSGTVGVRNRTIAGGVSRELRWECP
jgi:hypothetical protein